MTAPALQPDLPSEPPPVTTPQQAPVNTIPVTGLSLGLGSVAALVLFVGGGVAGYAVKSTKTEEQVAALQGLVIGQAADLKALQAEVAGHALRIQALELGKQVTDTGMGELKSELKDLKKETSKLREDLLEAIGKLSRGGR